MQQSEKWGRQLEFIFSTLGYAVGYGNIWRFPYQTYKFGGGAFLIPFVVCMFLVGIPTFGLEVAMGQYASLGATKAFENIMPIFWGVGWALVLVSFLCQIYYVMILAWSLYFLGASWQWPLPWATCNNNWNTEDCHSNQENLRCRQELNDSAAVLFNKTCLTGKQAVAVASLRANRTFISPSEEYFINGVLQDSGDFEVMGEMSYSLAACLFTAWVIVFLCVMKGVKSSGKVVYLTATLPYVLIVALLIRGLTLPGSSAGIYFYIIPNWTTLLDVNVWIAAAIQVFYTYGVAYGVLINMASHNKFSNNICRDTFLVCIIDSVDSIFTGFAIFSIVGFMAHDLQKSVPDVVRSGLYLAFVAYPEALSMMPGGVAWSVLFFIMMVVIGVDSQFAMVDVVSSAFIDEFVYLRKRRTLVTLIVCIVSFVCGLPLCMQGGIYVFTVLNDYAAGYCIIALAFVELAIVSYFYGVRRFISDCQMMIGHQGYLYWSYWMIAWSLVAPAFLLCVFVATVAVYEPSRFGDYVFSTSAEGVGWFLATVSLIVIPLCALGSIVRAFINNQPIRDLFKPTRHWCPERTRNLLELAEEESTKFLNGGELLID